MADRHTVDTITADALNALYEQLEAAEETEAQRQLTTMREALAFATVRAASAETQVKHWLAFIERFPTHMQFSLPRPDGTTEQLPCADWCYACRVEKAEGAVERVHAIQPLPLDTYRTGVGQARAKGWNDALSRVLAALDGTEQPTDQPSYAQLRAAYDESWQLIEMQKEFIGKLRQIIMTAITDRESVRIRTDHCVHCGRDHMNELYEAIIAADKGYAEAFPATADGPARPGRLPEQPTTGCAPGPYDECPNCPRDETKQPATEQPTAVDQHTAAALSRVIDLQRRWTQAGAPPLGTSVSRWWDARLVELNEAILGTAPGNPS